MIISALDDMSFGQRLRKIREEKGMTQEQLAERLGYVGNSYISDVEINKFIPKKKKMKEIAKALGVSFKKINDQLIESKIEQLGIKEPELQELFREIPKLNKKEKNVIINAYLKIKKRK